MAEPRIVPPDEARALQEGLTPGPWHVLTSRDVWSAVVSETHGAIGMDFENDADAKITAAAHDLAHTAAVLGDQMAAVRAAWEAYDSASPGNRQRDARRAVIAALRGVTK